MQHNWVKHKQGFTIVELLIVIVVIAILAAISVVAYTGIQNRANDSAVQNDLSNFAKKIQLIAAESGEFPAGGTTAPGGGGNATTIPGFTFNPTKSAYMTTVNNLYYCTGVETASGQKVFRVGARSKSGTLFVYSSSSGLENRGNTAVNSTVLCNDVDEPFTWGYGYNPGASYGWFAWTDG
jgi:prepilin-type N-terminal cleavage/methylation domain-containing protein